MSFQLVPKSVTLNDLEGRNSRRNKPYFALFHWIWQLSGSITYKMLSYRRETALQGAL